MAKNDLQIKISVEAQLGQLRAMESQLQRQIVQLRTLGDTGSTALKDLERNLGMVRTALGNIDKGDKFSTALGDMLKNIPAVGAGMQALNGTAVPVAAAFGVAVGAVRQFQVALDFADQLQDTSEQLNVTASSLQALNAHFGDAGVKAPQVAQTILKLKQSLAEAAAGSEPLSAAFAALNLNVAELRDLAPDEALARVGRALAAKAGSAAAAAAAQDILGRGTGRLANALRDLGTQGLGKIKEDMTDAGRVLDDALVQRLAAANQQWEALLGRMAVFRGELAGVAMRRADNATGSVGGAAEEAARFVNPAAGDAVGAARAYLDRERQQADEARQQARQREIERGAQRAGPREAAAARAAEAAAAEVKKNEQLAVIATEQAALDEQMLAAHTARLAVADQIAVAEEKLARLRGQMPAEDDASVEAARRKVELGKQILAQDEALQALKTKQAAETAKLAEENERSLAATRQAAAITAASAVAQLETERQLLASNANLDPVFKASRLAELTERLRKAQEQVVALKRAEIALAANPLDEARAKAALADAESKLAGIGAGSAPDPRTIDSLRAANAEANGPRSLTVGEAPEAASLRMLNQFGSDGEIVARGVGTAFQGVFDGLRGSIQGLIEGTMTWGDALRNIGSSILSGVISAISEMFATWIAKRILIHTLGLSFLAAEGAAETAKEAATLPAKTAGAAAAGISSYGLAIAGGLAAVALIASLSGGFAEGGAVSGPGTGTSDSIFARLSNGEHVMTAAAVQRVGGHGVLDAINAGRIPDLASLPAAGGSSPAAAPAVSMSNHFHFDPNEAMRQALADPAGRRLVTDLLRQIQYEI